MRISGRDQMAISTAVAAVVIVVILIIAAIGGYALLSSKSSSSTTTSSSTSSQSSSSSAPSSSSLSSSSSSSSLLSSSSLTTSSLSSSLSSSSATSASGGNKTLTAGFLFDVDNLNPVDWFTISDLDVLQLVYNTLVEANSSGLPAPGLASSWTVSPNGTVYTFNLVHNAMWQDGKPVTASDVAFTFQYWAKYKFPYYAALAGGINSSYALNNYTAVVVLNHPSAGFLLDLIDLGMIIPQHVWSTVTSPDNYTGPGYLTGDGPFSFISRTPGVNIILKANPSYFA